jgi:hypothetical protein
MLGGDSNSTMTKSMQNMRSTTIAEQALEKLVIENNIFLKAALQLLDQRDHSRGTEEANSFKDGSSADVIMCGTLMSSLGQL